MKFRHIEVFQAVMETGSMSAAGRLIHLTQPAVSKLIAHAEAQLGYPLFHRAGGRLVPTPEGVALFAESSDLFQRLEAFRRMAHHLKSGEQGRLKVGAIPALCHKLLPDVLTEFRRKQPDVVCEIHTVHKRQMPNGLLARDIDVGLDFFGISHPGVSAKVVGSGALYLMLPAGQGAAPKAAEVRKALKAVPMVALLDDDPIMVSFTRHALMHGLRPRVVTQVQTSQLAEELVARGGCWTVVDFLSAARCGPGVRVAPLQPSVECTVNAFFMKNQAPTLLARKFVESVKAVMNR